MKNFPFCAVWRKESFVNRLFLAILPQTQSCHQNGQNRSFSCSRVEWSFSQIIETKVFVMEIPIYIVGSEPFSEWERRNGHPTSIALQGEVPGILFCQFAREFDYSNYKYISVEGLTVLDYGDEDEDEYEYEEEDNDEDEFEIEVDDKFEEGLRNLVCTSGCQLFEMYKVYLNAATNKEFVVSDGCIFSADKKTLVHIPEAPVIEVPDFVEHIGAAACCGYEKMSSLILHDGLKTIGKWAFISAEFSVLRLPDSVTTLGECAFLMSGVERVYLSNSLEAIPDECFNLCFIEEFSIPPSVKAIGNYSLTGLLLMEEIDVPEGVESIGYYAFNQMNRVSLPSTLKSIEPDFYYEECIDVPDYPPYITVHPDNKTFVSKDGSLYFRESGKLAIDSAYHGQPHN